MIRTSIFSMDHQKASDPISLGMGGVVHCSPHFENPSNISFLDSKIVYISYRNEYEIKELGEWNASLVIPSQWAHQHFCINHFGFENYNHSSLKYGVGKILSKRWSLGTSIRLKHLYFAGCQEAQLFLYCNIGASYKHSDKIDISLLTHNILESELTSTDEERTKENHALMACSSFRFLDNARWCLEIEENNWCDWNIRNGFEFVHERLSLRCGFYMLPIIPTFGCGFNLDWVQLDVSSSYHNQLGYSLAIGIGSKF